VHKIDNEGNVHRLVAELLLMRVGLQNLALDLISVLQILPTSCLLRSSSGSKNLLSDLSCSCSRIGFAMEAIIFTPSALHNVLCEETTKFPDRMVRRKIIDATT
jgi:hypothetical protein